MSRLPSFAAELARTKPLKNATGPHPIYDALAKKWNPPAEWAKFKKEHGP